MSADRERAIADMMARTGKTRGQVEAFLDMVGSAMGWRPKLTEDEKRERLDAFLDAPLSDGPTDPGGVS